MSDIHMHISMQEKRIAQLRDELAHAEELRQAFVATLNTAGDFLKRVLDEDRSVLQRERELSDQLAAALNRMVENNPWQYLSCCKYGPTPGCRGCGMYYDANAALAQYAAIGRGPENDKGCEGQASAGEPTK